MRNRQIQIRPSRVVGWASGKHPVLIKLKIVLPQIKTQNIWSEKKVHKLIAVKVFYNLIAENHHDGLQSTPLGKLCTDASA
jgi:hypothetical protein